MLYNIEDLDTNLGLLLTQFQNIVQQIDRAKQKIITNKQSLLLRIPKILLLHNIMIYLSDSEILNLSSVCKTLRRLVYSPVGWKVLSYSRLPIRVKYKVEKVQQDRESDLHFDERPPPFHPEQIKILTDKKAVMKQTLNRQSENFASSKEKYDGILEKIRVEKKLQQKYRDKGKILDEEVNMLQQIGSSYRENLKQLNDQFETKMKSIAEKEAQLLGQRQKLQNQKEALVGKIRQYQADIQKIKKEGLKAKEILKRVNNFLLYKEL